MKKEYIIPRINLLDSDTMEIMAASGVSSTNGIDYGGTDESGSIVPSAKSLFDDEEESNSVWDD